MAKRLSRAHFLILSTTPEGRITAGGWLVTSVHRLPNPITNICQQRQLKMQLGKKQPNKTANVNKITQHLSFQSSSNIETCYYVTWHVASRKKRFLAAALLQRQYATLQPISVQKAVSIQRANTKSIQKAQLSPSDRAMRLVSSNLANYYATVQKLLIRQVLTKPMV